MKSLQFQFILRKLHCAFNKHSIQHFNKEFNTNIASVYSFPPLIVQTKAVNVSSALYLCLSYSFISVLTWGRLLICLANQVNQTSANRLQVADVELICFAEFPCSAIAWQIVIEQVAECQADAALLVQKTISFLIDNKLTADGCFYVSKAQSKKFYTRHPKKQIKKT